MQPLTKLLICLILAGTTLIAHAAYNDIQEKIWAEKIRTTIKQGKIEWLDVPGRKAMAIYTPSKGRFNHGVIVILHDAGLHPDWPQVIRPLRTRLTKHGWSTLSIQLPVLGPEVAREKYTELFADTKARIQQAVGWLQTKGHKKIVLLGHGMGANMALHTTSTTSSLQIQGLIMINLESGLPGKQLKTEPLIFTLRLMSLDISGEHHDPDVRKHMLQRRNQAARAGLLNDKELPMYRQILVSGADRDFTGQNDNLIRRIRGWLKRHVADAAATKPGASK